MKIYLWSLDNMSELDDGNIVHIKGDLYYVCYLIASDCIYVTAI